MLLYIRSRRIVSRIRTYCNTLSLETFRGSSSLAT